MNRSLLARMVALVLVVLLGGYYIFIDVLQYRIGAQRFGVTVMASDAGGIYPGAVVTYRGVPVGAVSSLELRTDGVRIHLGINPGTRIPADASVRIKELSALGEQYLDLDPSSPSPPYLHAGSTIPESRVTLPTPIGVALLDLGSLLSSVPTDDLQTLETFFTDSFTGTGPDLRTIIVTGQNLFEALVAAQAATVNLVNDGQPVLQTLQATDSQFATFAAGLRSITGQLDQSNSAIQGLITNGQSAETQLNSFLGANNSTIEALISSLATSAAKAQQYQPSVQALFRYLPTVLGDLGAVASGGTIHGEIAVNTANTVCPYTGVLMPLPTQAVSGVSLGNSCTYSAPDLLQRGAATAAPAVP